MEFLSILTRYRKRHGDIIPQGSCRKSYQRCHFGGRIVSSFLKSAVASPKVGEQMIAGSLLASLYASAYSLLALFNSKFFERNDLNLEASNFCLAWEMTTKVEMLGRHGRQHIRESLENDGIDFRHNTLSKGLRLNVLYS